MTKAVKSNQKSNLCRSHGNQLYANKNFFDALVAYNESLCLAEPGTENLGLAYANKSAVCFEMKLFDKCLRNVDLARQNHYPEKNLEILKKREEKCADLKKNFKEDKKSVDPWQLLKISQPNKALPFIADCLEMKADKKFGRHIIANRPLKPGEVIAIESPFCKIVQEKFIHQRCATCFKDDLLDLVPCLVCDTAMFCSACESDQKVHSFECSVPRDLIASLTSTQRMALQTFFTALSLFDGVDQLEGFLNENPESRTVFDLPTVDDKKQMLLAIHSLVSNCEINDESKLVEIFTKTPSLSEMWTAKGAFIRNFLKKQTQIATLNYHEIYDWPLKRGGFPVDDEHETSQALAYKRNVVSSGNASFPFSALVNHSCVSNVCKIFIDGKLLFVVTMLVDKGEQIFDSYGYSFTNIPKEYRQAELLKTYRFRCECAACKNDWPLMPNLKVIDKACFNKAKKVCRDLSTSSGQINQKKAFESFQEACSSIEKGRKNFPSIELCSLLQSASAFLELSYKPAVLFP